MSERHVEELFKNVGVGAFQTNPPNLLSSLQQVLPVVKQHPHIVARELHRMRSYFTDVQEVSRTPVNLEPVIQVLAVLAREVPELRAQIVTDLGDLLYEHLPLAPTTPTLHGLPALLDILEIPVSRRDDLLRRMARALATLRQRAIVVIGAGFSYETMPITSELAPLLIPLLRAQGVDDPALLLQRDDQRAWEIVRRVGRDFQLRFAGWSAKSKPSSQHNAIAEMLRQGQLSHLISLQLGDLCERAYRDRFHGEMPKVSEEGIVPDRPTLWKLHGDVERPNEPWIFPYERGRVFPSLMVLLDRATAAGGPAFALIVGYNEWEPEVRETLVPWLEANCPVVVRIRPRWPEENQAGIPDTARRFFERLTVYLQLEERSKT